MTCQACGHDNPAANRFCGGCGAALARACPTCGHANPADHRFCGACGASLRDSGLGSRDSSLPNVRRATSHEARAANLSEARKVVTVVFADLIGSTSLHERLDAESARRFMDRYYEALRTAVETHGGTVVKLLGDGVLAAFGVPSVAEDDAIRAVRAAVEMVQVVRVLGVTVLGDQPSPLTPNTLSSNTLSVRVGVNTGEVVVSAGNDDVVGDPVNVAARLQQEANAGDVVIGEATRRLVSELVTLAPLGALSLKGRAETVGAYRVVSLERPAGAAATAFVGRDDELRRIIAVCEAAVAAPAARLAVVLGSPGLGKSRLLDELARRLERTTIIKARCDPAGGATFAPIAKGLRALLQLDDSSKDARAAVIAALPEDADRDRIADGITALLAGTPASPEETFFIVRRFLSGLAAVRPVVLAIDDLQWAEPLLLDLIEHLVQWGSAVRLFIVAAARPELRDTRSSLATAGGLVTDVVTLGGLDAAAATRLAANVVGADALPAAVAGRVLATSEGNPLFLGELVRMLVNDGVLKKDGDRWTTDAALADLEMPPTIHALLAARIERLRPEDRAVLERAAVIGRQFSRTAVAHLLPREIGDLDARLEALRRSELIEPDTTWFVGEPALRFHHGLTRDAAYRRLLKGTRAELHSRFADWLESKVGDDIEHDETIGWHLEQAHQHLRELGPIDAQGRVLGERAARRLAAAGRRALTRDDLTPAGSLLGRALERLDAADPARADLALDWCEALLAAGDVAPARNAIDELERLIVALTPTEPRTPNPVPRLQAWHTCFAGQLAVLTDPQALRAIADAVAPAAEQLAALGDMAGEAKAHHVHAQALARLGEIGGCEAALDRALSAARRAHDRRRANAVLAWAPLAALWGPSPVTRASGRCLDVVRVLRITHGAPAVEAVALRCQAVLEALRGRTDAARRMIASSRRMVEELGITQGLLETEMFAGLIELIEGNTVEAERSLRVAYNGLRNHGLGIDAARAAALLGRTLLEQGRAAEAEALSHESEALAGDDLQAAITWRRVRAEALARRGEHASAVEFARAAADIAAATDALLHHADARLALATALRAAGCSNDAAAEQARASDLWEAKGATVLAERARRSAGRASGLQPSEDPDAAPRLHRRIQPNAATANSNTFQTAFAARDVDALTALFPDGGIDVVDHAMGETFHHTPVPAWRSLLRDKGSNYHHELLAALGDSLALVHNRVSGSGLTGAKFDIGAYEMQRIVLIEVDRRGIRRRAESFANDHLGDAVARLYERHAELLSDGPDRLRAAATARSIATLLGVVDLEAYATAVAQNVEFVDHAPFGMGSVHDAETFLRGIRSLLDVSSETAIRLDDVIDSRPGALLVRWTNFGTERATGGTYERTRLALWIFNAAGQVQKWEQFDPDKGDEALGRFDELVVRSRPAEGARQRRRIESNAATANLARQNAIVAAKDADALSSLFAEDQEAVHQPTGTTWDKTGSLDTIRSLWRAKDLKYWNEPLATLGSSLVLAKSLVSASGAAGRKFDVGPYTLEEVYVLEVDSQGRQRRIEFFVAEKLGEAIARLYERYADLLDGPDRTRAAATARSVAALIDWPMHVDDFVASFHPAIDFIDHRSLGLPSRHGTEEHAEGLRSIFDLSADVGVRVDDVLGLRADGLLLRHTQFGTVREGGGAYERNVLLLCLFGPEGLVTRQEMFDFDRDAEAIARFEELTGPLPSIPSPARRGGVQIPPSLEGKGARGIGRRLRSNAATANAARSESAIVARDADAFTEFFADDYHVINHMTGSEYGREGALTTIRSTLKAQNLTYDFEPLASLGDSLAVCHQKMSASGTGGATFDVGAYERDEIILFEVDAQGRRRRAEWFATDRLGDAVVRLYELYSERLPDGPSVEGSGPQAGPERARAATTARSVAAVLGPPQFDSIAAIVAPGVEFVDHRVLGLGSTRGAEAFRRGLRSVFELASEIANRVDDVIGLRADALLVRLMGSGTMRDSGGTYERLMLVLWVFGADGFLTHMEQFGAEREEEALARFDELIGSGPPRPLAASTENATAQVGKRFAAAWQARDWEQLEAIFPPEYRRIDRRALVRLELDRDQSMEFIRPLFDVSASALASELLATRGERLALSRFRFEGSDHTRGPTAIEHLVITEVDDEGNLVLQVIFDPDDLDAAYAELNDRYAAGEAAPHPTALETMRRLRQGIAARDWEGLASLFVPDFVLEEHRQLRLSTLQSAEEYMVWIRTLVELAPDVVLRLDHILAVDDRGALGVGRWVGTREGGAFEISFASVTLFDIDGRIRRVHTYDPDQLDEARARFAELRLQFLDHESGPRNEGLIVQPAAEHFTNAAARTYLRFVRSIRERDWDSLVATVAPAPVLDDRRRLVRLMVSGEEYFAHLRMLCEASWTRWDSELIATRGDRLALFREHIAGTAYDGVDFASEQLALEETDPDGRFVAGVSFDPDDLDAAYAELDERYVAGEAAPFAAVTTGARAFAAAVAAREWDALAAVLAADLVVYDHRPLGWETLRGPTMLVDTFKSLVELAPDVRMRIGHITVSESGSLAVPTFSGTHQGGAFEDTRVVVHEYDENGKIRQHDIYTLDQLEAARARFAEIAASRTNSRPDPLFWKGSGNTEGSPLFRTERAWGMSSSTSAADPLAAPAQPNAATAARDRVEAAFEARDWAAMRALCVDAKFDDRRRHMLLTGGDIDGWIADRQRWVRSGVHIERQVVGTAGARVALERMLVTSGPDGGRSEFELLYLTEVDDSGRIVAVVLFDLHDWRAARSEAQARWCAGDPMAAAVIQPVLEIARGFDDHDRERMRAVLADDLVVADHRLTGPGEINGADAYVESLANTWAMVPDIQNEWFALAYERHGSVGFATIFGTLDGGAFEVPLVSVQIVARGRVSRIEIFEIGDVDAALGRLADLHPPPVSDLRRTGPDPLRIPSNAATRTIDRWIGHAAAGDWDAFRSLCEPSMVFDDRRRIVLTTGDRDALTTSFRYVYSLGGRPVRALLATAGDTLSLERILWKGAGLEGALAFEVETLTLTEIDAEGRIVARIHFDPDDRRAASIEMQERYARGDEARCIPAATKKAVRAWAAHDLDRYRAAVSPDFVLDDRRHAGLGRLDFDDYIASVAAVFAQTTEEMIEPLYILAAEKHGLLTMAHAFGKSLDGGEYDMVYVSLARFRGDEYVGLELFEPEDLDVARARFEELRG